MTIKIRIGGELKTVSRVRVKIAGVLREVISIRGQVGGLLKTYLAPAFSVSIGVSGSIAQTNNPVVRNLAANIANGVPPYSYSWTVLSYSGGDPPSLGNPVFASTSISMGFGSAGSGSAQVRIIATDGLGRTASATSTVNFLYNSIS